MWLWQWWQRYRKNKQFQSLSIESDIRAFLNRLTLKDIDALTYSPSAPTPHYRQWYLRRFELTGYYPYLTYQPNDIERIITYIQEQTRWNGHPPRFPLSVILSVLGPLYPQFKTEDIYRAMDMQWTSSPWPSATLFHHQGYESAHIDYWLNRLLNEPFFDLSHQHEYLHHELPIVADHQTLNHSQKVSYAILCCHLGDDIAKQCFSRYFETSLWFILESLTDEERRHLLQESPSDLQGETEVWF